MTADKDDGAEYTLTWEPIEFLIFTPAGPVPLDEFIAEPAADEPAVITDPSEGSI